MKIGIDIDGVVIDSETTMRTYEEIYALQIGKKIVDRDEPKLQSRYNWTKEEQSYFFNNYLLRAAKESGLMSGFKVVYELLKEQGHEFVVITARGGFVAEMKDNAQEVLDSNGISFDKFYWHIDNKLEICQKENVDIMIDDDYKIVEKLAQNGIKTLYFRDTNLKKLEENEYLKEVNNWGDIYRYFCENAK